MNTLTQLQEVEGLKEVPAEQLEWLIQEGELLNFEEGSYLFKPGDPIDRLIIILMGSVVLKTKQGNQFRVAGNLGSGSITGYLPYSRADMAFGFAEVMQKTVVLVFPKSRFHEMISQHEELTAALVHVMSSRIRQFTKAQQQNDKMMALGKLSAGLAHELNNPSAAVVRSAQTLEKHLKLLPGGFKSVIKIKMTDSQVDAVNALLFDKMKATRPRLTMMEQSSLEDELLDWLEENDVKNPDDIVENLVAFGFGEEDLDVIATHVSNEDLTPVINWMNQMLTTDRLVGEIEEASQRINTLVNSVKRYTHMDQAPEKISVDIHEGLESTLTMLNHKLKKSNITLNRVFDSNLNKANILVSEMNQVWTNLIDNAIDAMENVDHRDLTIETSQNKDFINVFIKDSGPGIPEEIQGQIFDPFFTTKAIGKGTGLGLEVVHQIVTHQHNGSITFDSKPGETVFKVCFPIN